MKPSDDELRKINRKIFEISVKNDTGLESIFECIERMFKLDEIKMQDGAVITNIRHQRLIMSALENIKKAIEAISNNLPIDIIAINVKEAMENFAEVLGNNVSEDIINEIFKKFCLGK